MSTSEKTILTLARSLDRHFSELGMGPRELVSLACALIDRAAAHATARQDEAPAPKKAA